MRSVDPVAVARAGREIGHRGAEPAALFRGQRLQVAPALVRNFERDVRGTRRPQPEARDAIVELGAERHRVAALHAGMRRLHQQHKRAALQRIFRAGRCRAARRRAVFERGVELRVPRGHRAERRQLERDRIVMRVEEHQETCVVHRPRDAVGLRERVAGEINAEAAREILGPLLGRHLDAVGFQPHDVLGGAAAGGFAGEEMAAPEDRMLAAQRDHARSEFVEAPPALVVGPVEPRDRIVLAIRIVVAALRAPGFVAGLQHRHALRQQQGAEQVALLFFAQRDDRGIVGLALDAAVPREIVVVAVAVALAVRFVVLVVIGDEIVQREAVVRGHEIHAWRTARGRCARRCRWSP